MEKFMENKKGKMGLIKPENQNLNEFFGIKEAEKVKESQSNIRWTKEERELLDQGHEACLDNMPLYQYQKIAILERAKKDIEEREQINAMRANIKK